MGQTDSIILYSSQAPRVIEAIERDGVAFSKPAYVRHKYRESAGVFLAAYDWFVSRLERVVPKPQGAEYPYWAFPEYSDVEHSPDQVRLKLLVPKDEVVLFDRTAWTTILKLQYLADTEGDAKRFRENLRAQGIRQDSDLFLTSFYPSLRAEVEASWDKLFLLDERLKANLVTCDAVQAGLWCIKRDWLID